MIRSFYQLFDKKMIILLICMLIMSPTLGGQNTYTICLIYSHYLAIYLNNVYLLMIYQYSSRLNSVSSYIITRIGEKTFYSMTYFIFISVGCLYTFIIYISYYFFFGPIAQDALYLTILFMIINLVITGIEMTIIYFQIGQKKNFIYLILPIIINVLFHISYTKLF